MALEIKWHKPTAAIRQRVRTYVSTLQDYSTNPELQYNSQQPASQVPLSRQLGLKYIQWLRQTHSAVACQAPTLQYRAADASWTTQIYAACAVLTADCLPVFFTNAQATLVAVAHAGWRGLAAGILQQTLAALQQRQNPANAKIYAAFGPAISQEHYEVGTELRRTFSNYPQAFKLSPKQQPAARYQLSLYKLAAAILVENGVSAPPLPSWCTYRDCDKFVSYRRSQQVTGDPYNTGTRLASLIWLQ